MSTTTCLGCSRRIPLGQSRCRACRKPKASIAERAVHNRVRGQVLAQERVCWICHRPGTPDDPLTLDHVVARARGGRHTRRNGRAAHRSCNGAKGAGEPRQAGIRVV